MERAKEACELLVINSSGLLTASLKVIRRTWQRPLFRHLFLSQEEAFEIPEELEKQYPAPFVILFSLNPIHIDFETGGGSYDLHSVSRQLH